ncbi:MAG: Stp1/IreP family PP2C-type Ser/Thr phosphatase [Clostridia bacterium]|nr:Stp1/IreP family PP2C-type Ser/Thr phosphatase [Clostridia bacterium]
MKISAKSDIGRVRSSNQDYYLAGELDNGVTWAVVCDGMGGAMGGNIASETAAKMIAEKLSSGYHAGMNDNSVKHLIVSAVEAANASVFSKSRTDETLSGMGTTAVVAVINSDTMYLAHVGDSRIYVLSKDSINQLTTDHSVVQMMIDNGEITREEAKDHPKKNVITRALGVEDSVRIDYAQEVYNEGETVLLCSDGLTNFLTDEEILELCRDEDSYSLAEKLVDAANSNGGGDNITVVTISD